MRLTSRLRRAAGLLFTHTLTITLTSARLVLGAAPRHASEPPKPV